MQELSDEDISVKVQAGDSESFGILVTRYEAKMMRYANKFLFGYEEAQDVVQEVFLKAYIHIQSFDSKQKFSSWLYRIAHNEFINAIKKKGKEPLPLIDPDMFLPHLVAKQTADDEIHKKETAEMLEKCLNKLDPKYREPLVLYYIEELDYKDVADILRLPTSTVGVRLKRGKDMLKKAYDELYPSL